MVEYDDSVINKHAQRLYDRANAIVFLCALLGFMVMAFAVAAMLGGLEIHALGAGLVGLLIGIAVGRSISFELELRAQTALCQVKIERHTRQAAMVLTAMQRQQQVDPGPQPGPPQL